MLSYILLYYEIKLTWVFFCLYFAVVNTLFSLNVNLISRRKKITTTLCLLELTLLYNYKGVYRDQDEQEKLLDGCCIDAQSPAAAPSSSRLLHSTSHRERVENAFEIWFEQKN